MVSYLIDDERTDEVEKIISPILKTLSHVPTLWIYEISSALRLAEKRARISETDINSYLAAIKLLLVDHHHPKAELIVEIRVQLG